MAKGDLVNPALFNVVDRRLVFPPGNAG